MKSHFERMFRSLAWANAEVFKAVRACPPAESDAVPMFGQMLGAERVWIARLEGRESGPVWPRLTLAECENLSAQNAEGFLGYIDSLGEADFTRAISYRSTKGESFTSAISDILTHVVLNGSFFRGQIVRKLIRSGGEPPTIDYMTFARVIEPVEPIPRG